MRKFLVAALLCVAGSAKAQTLTTINENLWTTGNWQYFDTSVNGASVFAGTVSVQGLGATYGITAATVTTTSSMTASAFFGDGSHLTGIPSTGSISGVYLPLAGGSMTGQLTTSSTMTVQGNAFSVGGSTLVVKAGQVGIGTASPTSPLTLANNNQFAGLNTGGSNVNLAIVDGSNNVKLGDVSANSNDTYVQSSNNIRLNTGTSSGIYTGITLSTQTAGTAGSLVTVSCAANYYVISGGCTCTGGVAATGFVNMPYPSITVAGSMPTGWQCQETGTTGGACSAYAICSKMRF